MIIHLGYETRAEVIDSVLGQLSDGIWENSSAMDKYWMFADVDGTDLVIDDEPFRDEKGWGRYGSTIKRTQNGFAGKSEKQIKDWFANKAKQVVKIWAEDEGKDPKVIWSRANDDDVVDYMGGHKVPTITVADVYECYDFLKGRSGKKYGIAANPLPYEVECSTRRTFTKYPRYVKATKYTIEYDDERIQEVADLVKDYLTKYLTKNILETLTEPDYGYDSGRLVVSKIAKSINTFFVNKSKGTAFQIDIDGKVKHAYNIGNNNQFQVLLIGRDLRVVCGYIYITKGLYNEAYIGVKDLDENLVGSPYELRATGFLLVNDKPIRRI